MAPPNQLRAGQAMEEWMHQGELLAGNTRPQQLKSSSSHLSMLTYNQWADRAADRKKIQAEREAATKSALGHLLCEGDARPERESVLQQAAQNSGSEPGVGASQVSAAMTSPKPERAAAAPGQNPKRGGARTTPSASRGGHAPSARSPALPSVSRIAKCPAAKSEVPANAARAQQPEFGADAPETHPKASQLARSLVPSQDHAQMVQDMLLIQCKRSGEDDREMKPAGDSAAQQRLGLLGPRA